MKQKTLITVVLLLAMMIMPNVCMADSTLSETGGNDELHVEENTSGSAYDGVFPDVSSSDECAEAVYYLSEAGIINGDEKGYFNPESKITRAEAVTIICRMMDAESEAKTSRKKVFDDVPVDHWASGYIAVAAERNVVNGNGDGTFSPESYLTYEQIVKMLVCLCGLENEAQNEGGWPNGYMKLGEELGITRGMIFDQKAYAPREDVARLAYNATNIMFSE